MFIDASAIVSILLAESDADLLEDRIMQAQDRLISPLAIFEASLAVNREKAEGLIAAQAAVGEYVATFLMTTVPITAEIGRIALDARARYGKGTGHPARLNMGDCFAYACARAHGVRLLYKGDDFVHTDLA